MRSVTIRQEADGFYVAIELENKTISHCGLKDKKNRHKESFLCLNCGTPADADNNASITLAKRGITKLGIGSDTLLVISQEVTGTPESQVRVIGIY